MINIKVIFMISKLWYSYENTILYIGATTSIQKRKLYDSLTVLQKAISDPDYGILSEFFTSNRELSGIKGKNICWWRRIGINM